MVTLVPESRSNPKLFLYRVEPRCIVMRTRRQGKSSGFSKMQKRVFAGAAALVVIISATGVTDAEETVPPLQAQLYAKYLPVQMSKRVEVAKAGAVLQV